MGEAVNFDLCGPDEIAARLGVRSNTVSMWRTRGLLPEPFTTVSRVPMWSWALIRAWADATGRLSSDGAIPKVSRDEVNAARALVLAELDALADDATGILDRFGVSTTIRKVRHRATVRDYSGRFHSLDGQSNGQGEWDWYWQLGPDDRAWLARSHQGPEPHLLAPDQVAHLMGADVDRAMSEWVRCLRVIDAASAIRGRVTWRRCSHLFNGLELSHDPFALFGTFAEAATYLADLKNEPCTTERTGELLANLGPSPLDMSFETWADELGNLERQIETIEMPTGEWDILSAKDQAVFTRIEELLPSSIGDAANGRLEDVYVCVVGAYLAVAV